MTRSNASAAGFTLVEVLIAMAISTSTSVKPAADALLRVIGLLLGEITIEGVNR